MVTRENGWGEGIDWQFGIDMYTKLKLKPAYLLAVITIITIKSKAGNHPSAQFNFTHLS